MDQIFQKCVQNSTQGGTLVFKLKIFENNISLNLNIVVPKVSSCWADYANHNNYFKITETVKIIGQKLKICAKKARAANKRRVAFLAKIATRWIYFIHIFRQLLVPNLSKSEKKSSVLALGAYYTDYMKITKIIMTTLLWSTLKGNG